jgi:hypothetical protein
MIQPHRAGSDRHCFAKQLAPERSPTAAAVPVPLAWIIPVWFARKWMVNLLGSWSNTAVAKL